MSVSYPETPPPVLPPGKQQVTVPVVPVEEPVPSEESVPVEPVLEERPDNPEPGEAVGGFQESDTNDNGASEGTAPGGEPSEGEDPDASTGTDDADGEDTAP